MRAKITLIVIAATVIYAVLGGVVFHYLEQGYELELTPVVLNDISQYTTDVNPTNCMNWSDVVALSQLFRDMTDSGIYISSSGQLLNVTKWDVRTSIFATISILTSIGYKVLSPDFVGGRVFCIFYGWIGIPLFFSANVVIGKVTLKIIKEIGKRMWRKKFLPKSNIAVIYIVYNIIIFAMFMLVPAAIFSHIEKWTYAQALYFCFQTLFLIGFGDYTPGFNREVLPSEDLLHWYRLMSAFWLLILAVLYVSQLMRFIAVIDHSSERTEDKVNEKLAAEKHFLESNWTSENEAKWSRGTTVMIQGDTLRRKTGKQVNLSPDITVYPATGNPYQQSTETPGYVNVISLNQNSDNNIGNGTDFK